MDCDGSGFGFKFDLNVTIVGLGLIGGSYAKALRALNPKKIFGIDLDVESLDNALKTGVIDEGYTNGDIVLKKSDLIIIALYPTDTIKFIENNLQNIKENAVITDSCGLKKLITEKMLDILPGTIEFVGGHPMAGKESKGFTGSSKDIFLNSNYIITPNEKNSEKNIKLIEDMAKAIGCKNVVRITPVEHDRIISYTSHLPHIVAVSLINSEKSSDITNLFIGGSFKDTTRIATINSELWAELFVLNSDNLICEIEKFEESLLKIKNAIKLKDRCALQNIFTGASLKRKKMFLNENS